MGDLTVIWRQTADWFVPRQLVNLALQASGEPDSPQTPEPSASGHVARNVPATRTP